MILNETTDIDTMFKRILLSHSTNATSSILGSTLKPEPKHGTKIKQTDRQTDRQTETDRQTDRESQEVSTIIVISHHDDVLPSELKQQRRHDRCV